jgi:hypothetical protein
MKKGPKPAASSLCMDVEQETIAQSQADERSIKTRETPLNDQQAAAL